MNLMPNALLAALGLLLGASLPSSAGAQEIHLRHPAPRRG